MNSLHITCSNSWYVNSFKPKIQGIIETSVCDQVFEKRHSILTKNRFIQYSPIYPFNLLLCVDLIKMQIRNFRKINNTIMVQLQNIIIILKIDDQKQLEQWQIAFADMFAQLQPTKKIRMSLSLDKIWIDKQQLSHAIQTLDILLFRHEDHASKFQRLFTRSEFDHIGILIKQNQQIFLLDATKASGVRLLNWDEILHKIKKCSQVGYRKVLNKKQNQYQFFQQNIDDLINCPYEFSLFKMLGKSNKTPTSYFCSQLVAQIFKRVKLMPQNCHSNTFYPGDFASSHNKRLGQLKLSQIMNICFN